MLCDICGKNQANIHITEVVDGHKKSVNLCAVCAAENGQAESAAGIDLADLLQTLSQQFDLPLQMPSDELETENSVPTISCPRCGWDSTRLRKTGRLGCAHCYKTFAAALAPALRSMHRGAVHIGKTWNASGDAENTAMLKLTELRRRLDDLVRREEYEEAAELRDEINALAGEIGE